MKRRIKEKFASPVDLVSFLKQTKGFILAPQINPQQALGSGISSYHQQLIHLFFLFLALLTLHIPAMLIYNGYGFYKDTLSSLSLGNMGFS